MTVRDSFRSRSAAAISALIVVILGAAVGIAIAQSTPPTVTTLVPRTPADLAVVQTVAVDEYDSGWHTHPGPVIVQVQEGTFKIYQGSCEPQVVHEGQTFIEIPFVPVRAVSKGPIKWTTSLILPPGYGARENVPSPCRE